MKYRLKLSNKACISLRLIKLGLLACISLLSPQIALAQQTISLSWALEQTLIHNGELQLYPYELRIAEGDKIQAQLSPKPTIGLEIEDAFGNGDRTALSEAEFTLSLGQTIELGNKLKHRVTLADAKLSSLSAQYNITRLNTLAETSRRYYRVLYLQALEDLYNQRLEQEQNALSVIKRRAIAGAVGQADVSKMALRLAESQVLQQQLIAQQQLAKARLAAMWLAEADFEHVGGTLSQWPAIPDMTSLSTAINQAPTYLLQHAQQQLANSQLQLAKANGYSNLDLGVGIRRFAETDDQALIFSLSMPLTLSNPNRGVIAAAQAQRQKTFQQAELTFTEIKLALQQIQQQLTADSQYATSVSQTLLPYANTLLKETQKGYQDGRYSVIQWVDAQTELFELQTQLVEIHRNIYLQLLELERITGQALTATDQDKANSKTGVSDYD